MVGVVLASVVAAAIVPVLLIRLRKEPPTPSVSMASTGFSVPVSTKETRTTEMDTAEITMTDVNNDDRSDIIVSDYDERDVGVLLSNGPGAFAPIVVYRSHGTSFSLSITDLSGDNRPDIVVRPVRSSHVGVMLNVGDGTFGLETLYEVGQSGQHVSVADMNGDLKPDLVVLFPYSHTVEVHLNTGDANYVKSVSLSMKSPFHVALGDVNDDGHVDIILTNKESKLFAFLNLEHSANREYLRFASSRVTSN